MPVNPASTEGRAPSPEDEIRHLERQLEERKRALAERGEGERHEKEVFREVLKEHIEREREQPGASEIPHPVITPPISGTPHTAPAVKKEEERQEMIHALVETALTKSIRQAVRMAQGQSPHLLDELHDHLVDDYYDKLIQLRRIKPL